MEKEQSNNSDAFETLAQLTSGYCVARCLHVITELGVADVLESSPRTAPDLANAVGVSPDALGRMMRLLATFGVFQQEGEAFKHSPVSELLRSSHPQSMQPFVRLFGLPVYWNIYEKLTYSLQTGRPAAEKVVPEGLWDYFGAHPEDNKIFNAAMATKAVGQVAGVMAAYDFSGFKTIADIGGGRGHLLKAVLAATPTAKGLLFDLPHVVAEAAGLASERLSLQAGDFFKDPLPVADAYLVMEIIHDWADEEALMILQAIRQAAPAHAKLLLVEQLIPDAPGPHWSKMLDIHMLTLLGGRQRNLQEYQNLLAQAGFQLEREIQTFAGVSILEAVCV
ncbi:methyltransferase [Adhaeribacter aerolatus]|uniref:Methyltransferase n=1 Tax=Adhaeribacter aerolatus TaxID=670289 RepID=A0A512AZM2_9BACT|nr:methyltransferase [Adhaeribacter aerolatus]GEO05154.1 methyltransferase [Adhaeribacter aerolatus]